MQGPSATSGPGADAQDSSRADAQSSSRSSTDTRIPNSRTLLAIFERPPQAVGQTINSAVIIAAESRADYPQVKTAADYFGPISDLAQQSGLKPVSDPYAYSVGTKALVREDFTGDHGKVPIYQSSLVLIEKGQIVSFNFVAGSEDDVDLLIANLQFSSPSREPSRPQK